MKILSNNDQKKAIVDYIDYLVKERFDREEIKQLTKQYYSDYLENAHSYRFKETSSVSNEERFRKATSRYRKSLSHLSSKATKATDQAKSKNKLSSSSHQSTEGEEAESPESTSEETKATPAKSDKAPAEEGATEAPSEKKYLLNLSASYKEGDYAVGDLRPDVNKELVAPEGTEDKNGDLNALPKPRVLDRPFTPDLMDPKLQSEMYPDEFYGIGTFQVYHYAQGKLKEFNPGKPGENKVFFSPNYLELRVGDIIVIATSKLYASCKTLDAMSVCSVKDKSGDQGFKTHVEAAGLNPGDSQAIFVESTEGSYIFKFQDLEATEYLRSLVLFLAVKNASRTVQFQSDDGGLIEVDSNAGTIRRVTTVNGEDLVDIVNINSLTSILYTMTKSEVELEYLAAEAGASEPAAKKIVLIVPKKPEGVEPTEDGEFWYSHSLYKAIDSAMNLYYYFYIEQKKEVFLTGIQDVKANFDSPKLQLLYSYKYPLKMLKQIDNQMSTSLSCLQKASILVYFAELYSAQNPFIAVELLYFYYVKGVFPSVNPTFSGVEYYNWLKFFKTQNYTEDGHGEIYIKHAPVTSGIAHRFLYYINLRQCGKGEKVTYEDYLDILKYSAKHFDWKTNPVWEPYRDEITSFVPHIKKPDTKQACGAIQNTLVRGLLVQSLAVKDPHTLILNMIEKFPSTSLYILKELVTKQKEDLGPNISNLAMGISGAYPDLELTDDEAGLTKLVALMDDMKVEKLFLVKDSPDDEFKPLLLGTSTIIANISTVFSSMDSNLALGLGKKLVESFQGHFNSLNLYLMEANKPLIEEVAGDPMEEVKVILRDPKQSKLLLSNDKCKQVEDKGVRNFCANLEEIKSKECSADELKAMDDLIKPQEPSNAEGAEDVPPTPQQGKQCDPSVEEALGNLTLEELKDSITKTYSQARASEDLACELPKIYLMEVTMISNSVEESDGKNLIESQENYFLQVENHTKSHVHSHSKSSVSLQSREYIEKAVQFASNPDNSKCNGVKLINQLNLVLANLSMPIMKKALCAAMAHEPWRKAFAETNEQVYEDLAGSAEFPWWPLIPPNDFLMDEGNWSDIFTYLSCNYQCLAVFMNHLTIAGAFQAPVALKEIEGLFKDLSEDQKTPLDLVVEGILAKDADETTKLKEMLDLEHKAPHLLRGIRSILAKMNSTDTAPALTLALKESEQCTVQLDQFYKIKELSRPMATNSSSTNQVFQLSSSFTVQKLILNRMNTCQVLESNKLEDLKEKLSSVPNQDADFLLMLGKENVELEERFNLITETDEYGLKVDEHVLKFIETIFKALKDSKIECIWNNIIECACFTDLLKEIDFDLLEGISETATNEDDAIIGTLPLSDREMRDLMLDCSESVSLGATQYGEVAANCLKEHDDKAKGYLSKISEVVNELSNEVKSEMENILAGQQPDYEKLSMVMKANFANKEPEYSQIKEKIKEYVDQEDYSDTDTIKCTYDQSMEVAPLKKCAMEGGKDKIDCIKNPEGCKYVLGADCAQVQLSAACVPDTLRNLMNFTKDTSTKDNKVTITESDCFFDGAKVPTIGGIVAKSSFKIEVFDLKGSIEKCDQKKIESDVAELAELTNAIEGLKDEKGGECADGGECPGMEEMAGMEKDLLLDLTDTLQLKVADILKEQLENAAVVVIKKGGPVEEPEEGVGTGTEGALEDRSGLDLTNERESYIAGPDNLPRSQAKGAVACKNVFKAKYTCDLNFAFVFDEYLALCRKKGLCDAKELKQMRMEYVNLIKTMDSEQLRISPSDNLEIILSKIALVKEFIKPFTSRDDFGGIDEAVLDFSHANLQKVTDRLGIKSSCSASDAQGGRFVQKFLPEEVKKPDPKDLHLMVILTTVYVDSITSKPVYILALHNKLKKGNGQVHALSENMSEGDDVIFICEKQRMKGLVELAVSNKFKTEVSNAIASALPAIEGSAEEKQAIMDKAMGEFESTQRYITSLPCIMGALVQFGLPPAYPPTNALEEAYAKYLDMKKGVVPQADFWIMNKIKNTDPKGLGKQPTMMNILQGALTVQRFKAEGDVFRSLDVIKGIQKSLKGADYTRNLIRDVGHINFMSQGDGFLDYVDFRQNTRKEKAEEIIKEEKAAMKKTE